MLKMYVIRDQESQVYSPQPLGFPTTRDAKEAVRDLALDKQTALAKFPNDFRLIYIGDYDVREGQMVPKVHENICWVAELLPETEKEQ